MSREINRLEDGLDLTETGRPVTIDLVIKQMSTSDQDELVMSSKLSERRAELRSLALHGNRLHELHASFGQLVHLEKLDLRSNSQIGRAHV